MVVPKTATWIRITATTRLRTSEPSTRDDISGTSRSVRYLSTAALEFPHEIHELVDSGLRKGVVKRRPDPADRPMPFETIQSGCGRFLHERAFKILAGQPERDVHERSMLLPRRSPI